MEREGGCLSLYNRGCRGTLFAEQQGHFLWEIPNHLFLLPTAHPTFTHTAFWVMATLYTLVFGSPRRGDIGSETRVEPTPHHLETLGRVGLSFEAPISR